MIDSKVRMLIGKCSSAENEGILNRCCINAPGTIACFTNYLIPSIIEPQCFEFGGIFYCNLATDVFKSFKAFQFGTDTEDR